MILNELSQDIHPLQANNLSTMYPVDILIENAIEVRHIQESILDSMIDYQYTNIITESGIDTIKNIGKKIISIIDKFVDSIRKFFKMVTAKVSKTVNVNEKNDEELEKMIHDLNIQSDPKYKDKMVTYEAISPDFNADTVYTKLKDAIELDSYYPEISKVYNKIAAIILVAGDNDWKEDFHDSEKEQLDEIRKSIEQIKKDKSIDTDQSIDNITDLLAIDKSSKKEYVETLSAAYSTAQRFKSDATSTITLLGKLSYDDYIKDMLHYKERISKLCNSPEMANTLPDIYAVSMEILKTTLSITTETINHCTRISQHVVKIVGTNITIYNAYKRAILQAIIVAAKKR